MSYGGFVSVFDLYFCPVKKYLVIISMLILLKPVLPVLQYAINYDYIATVLCVNKDKPAMACNGKCHLMKELAKASEDEKPISSDKKNTVVETVHLFIEDIKPFEFNSFNTALYSKLETKYINLYTHLELTSIFHPPTFTA